MTVSCYYEAPKLYFNKTVKAAKDHTCGECGGKIFKGERHQFIKTLQDDYFTDVWCTARICPDCEVIICELKRLLSEGGSCGGWLIEGMGEQLKDLEDGPEERRIVAAYNASTAHRGGNRATRFDMEGDDE